MAELLDTVEKVENFQKANREETERLIKEALVGVPEVVKGAVDRAQARTKLPTRVPFASNPEGFEGGEFATDEHPGLLRRGYPLDAEAGGLITNLANRAPWERKATMLRKWSRYSPAARAYKELSEEQRFKEFLDYLLAVATTNPFGYGKGRVADTRIQKASFAEGGGDTGGFLVPNMYSNDLKALELEGANFEPRATTIPMNTMKLLMPTIRETTHVGSVYGGITAYWAPEAGAVTEVEPVFGQVALEAHKLTAYTVASNELLADSPVGLEALIRQRFPMAIRWYKESAYWNGDGGGQPEGVLNCNALIAVAKETGQASGTILFENILKMYSQMLPTSIGNAVWFIHPQCIQQLGTMALSVGTGGSAVFLANGGAQNDFPMTIFGRPVIPSEHMAGLGSQGDIAFVDLSYYLIGTRQDLSFEASPHVKFINDQTVWRFTERLDGKPWIDSALTLEHGSFSVSPFVTLAAR